MVGFYIAQRRESNCNTDVYTYGVRPLSKSRATTTSHMASKWPTRDLLVRAIVESSLLDVMVAGVLSLGIYTAFCPLPRCTHLWIRVSVIWDVRWNKGFVRWASHWVIESMPIWQISPLLNETATSLKGFLLIFMNSRIEGWLFDLWV